MQGIEMPRVQLKNMFINLLGFEQFARLVQSHRVGQLGTEIYISRRLQSLTTIRRCHAYRTRIFVRVPGHKMGRECSVVRRKNKALYHPKHGRLTGELF